jgi:hypothetical protein
MDHSAQRAPRWERRTDRLGPSRPVGPLNAHQTAALRRVATPQPPGATEPARFRELHLAQACLVPWEASGSTAELTKLQRPLGPQMPVPRRRERSPSRTAPHWPPRPLTACSTERNWSPRATGCSACCSSRDPRGAAVRFRRHSDGCKLHSRCPPGRLPLIAASACSQVRPP